MNGPRLLVKTDLHAKKTNESIPLINLTVEEQNTKTVLCLKAQRSAFHSTINFHEGCLMRCDVTVAKMSETQFCSRFSIASCTSGITDPMSKTKEGQLDHQNCFKQEHFVGVASNSFA